MGEKDLWPWFVFWIYGCFFIILSLHLHCGKNLVETGIRNSLG